MFNRVFSIRSLLAAKTAVTNASLITRTLKSDLKIKWIRPEKVSSLHPSKSGDRSTEAIYEKTEVALEFEKSDELKKYVRQSLVDKFDWSIRSCNVQNVLFNNTQGR